MEIKLDVNSENILSAEETRSLAASIKALQERVEEAEEEVARLREAVRQESARADKAEASLAEVRAAVQQAITDISASD
ncbi:hypothetical protein [Azospirillum canadense]|uniref:hypothetical protein n=1 Tax=Azospirillum canadense TaxID=403962 RepID=UPI002227590F|nr:hypothetical protein [Azospirillum canadense]MCW2239490.1 putative nucleic acid-binding Zn-ribbon protein [Azospirillum canadense]